MPEKEEIVRKIFSELSFSKNTFNFKCKNGFKALESRFVPVGDLTSWLAVLLTYRKDITISIETLEILIKNLSGKNKAR